MNNFCFITFFFSYGHSGFGYLAICENHNCPFAKNSTSRKNKKEKYKELCGNPKCPFSKKDKEFSKVTKSQKDDCCDNPSCPYSAYPNN